MFKRKYTISILTSKWEILKRNLKVKVIPRQNEFLYLDERYVKVISVVHSLKETQEIFIIIEEMESDINKKHIENE